MANQLAQNTLFFLGKSIIEYYQEEKFSTKYIIDDWINIDDTICETILFLLSSTPKVLSKSLKAATCISILFGR